jgi:hypothetical protein
MSLCVEKSPMHGHLVKMQPIQDYSDETLS